jgi:autotransporter-associated beta strand protein
MDTKHHKQFYILSAIAFILALVALPNAHAANVTWDGGGGASNIFWSTASNWSSDTLPTSIDTIRFSGTSVANNNDFATGTAFSGLTFNGVSNLTSSAFNLTGNSIVLSAGGVITTSAATTGTLTDTISLNVTMSNNNPIISTGTSHNLIIAGVLSGGAASLTKAGAGTLTLSGANTYTGSTVVTVGTLVLGNSLAMQNSALNTATSIAGGVNLSDITTLTLGGLTGGSGDLASVITTGYGGLTALTLNNSANLVYSGVIANGAANMTLTKTGAGTQTLTGTSANTYTGLTTVSAGGLTLAKSAGVDAIAGNVLVNGTLTLGASDQIKNTSNVELTGGTFAMATYNETVASVILNGGSINGGTSAVTGPPAIAAVPVTLTVGNSIDLKSGTTSGNVILAGTAGAIKTTSGTFTLNGANTYTGTTTLNAGTLQLGVNGVGSVGAVTSGPVGTGILALNGGTLSASGTSSRTLLNAVTINGNVTFGDGTNIGPLTFSAEVDLGGSSRTLTTSSNVNIDGNVSNGSIIKNGSGILKLGGANTYNGLTISGGTVTINGPNVGSVGSITSTSVGAGTVTFNGGSISAGTAVNRTILNAVNFTGNAGFGGIGIGTLAFSANANLGGDIRTLTTAVDTTFSGIISNGGINKAGASTLTLSGANTYTGNTTVSQGALQLATSGSLRFVIGSSGVNNAVTGTGTTTMNGQFVFDLTGASTNTDATWAIVAASLNPTYGTSFSVAGFIEDGLGNWTKETNGVRYIFSQSSSVLSVQSIGEITPYNAWVSSWPGFIQTAPTDDPDGDGYNNNMEFAFGGNPTVGSSSVLSAALVGSDVVISYVAMTTPNAVTYQVQSTTDLSTGEWSNLDVTIRKSGNQEGISQPSIYERKEFLVPTTAREFYRVQATIAP